MPELGRLRTVAEALTEIREDLDEDLDADTNFWSDDFLMRRFNRSLRYIVQKVREVHENWFVRRVCSEESAIIVYDEAYDPASLRIRPGIEFYALPPDCLEVRQWNAVRSADGDRIVLEPRNIASTLYQLVEGRSASEGTTFTSGVYFYDIIRRADIATPQLKLAPIPSLTADTELEYVVRPRHFKQEDTFEGSGFTDEQVDAAIARTVWVALMKGVDVPASKLSVAERSMGDAIQHAVASAAPRQTVAPPFVDGYLEYEGEYE